MRFVEKDKYQEHTMIARIDNIRMSVWNAIRIKKERRMSKKRKICGNCIYPDGGVCGFAGEISTNFTCSHFTAREDLTCETCADKNECEYAYDPYNTDGECLAIK